MSDEAASPYRREPRIATPKDDRLRPVDLPDPDVIYEALRSILIARRVSLGLTQEQLDNRLGVSERYVARLECGTRRPDMPLLCAWVAALNGVLAFAPLCAPAVKAKK